MTGPLEVVFITNAIKGNNHEQTNNNIEMAKVKSNTLFIINLDGADNLGNGYLTTLECFLLVKVFSIMA